MNLPPDPRYLPSFPTRRSSDLAEVHEVRLTRRVEHHVGRLHVAVDHPLRVGVRQGVSQLADDLGGLARRESTGDRKSTRLNSSHRCISYAVFCLKKKKKTTKNH